MMGSPWQSKTACGANWGILPYSRDFSLIFRGYSSKNKDSVLNRRSRQIETQNIIHAVCLGHIHKCYTAIPRRLHQAHVPFESKNTVSKSKTHFHDAFPWCLSPKNERSVKSPDNSSAPDRTYRTLSFEKKVLIKVIGCHFNRVNLNSFENVMEITVAVAHHNAKSTKADTARSC